MSPESPVLFLLHKVKALDATVAERVKHGRLSLRHQATNGSVPPQGSAVPVQHLDYPQVGLCRGQLSEKTIWSLLISPTKVRELSKKKDVSEKLEEKMLFILKNKKAVVLPIKDV